LPLKVIDIHLLAATVVDTAKHVNVIVVELGIVQETSEWHG